ncbi:right-handed parallel beta-helix repeat-containing protein [Protaetiibacter intestinalis]|uniref:Right-handed parallel beta-helix repeat-containing protein n=1 Tax=Protaetiibacter intestinalis TaxID=2419774 RepID=A0A387BK78_9MICO|nr:right-handed parallel beta-helix repeat-containing protein [Protaetiibacter intestinalis]AYF98930.1 right-handed parallel beta-helix repeat-containing protein [Protaetiibacter intestinalis]
MRNGLRGAALAVLVGALLVPAAGTQAAPADRYAAPAGSGTACTSSAPCAVPAAIAGASAGGRVLLTSGSYPDLVVSGGGGTTAAPVTVTSASGAAVTLTRVRTTAPHIIWSGLKVTTTFYLNAGSTGSTLTGMHFDGGGLFVRAAQATVTGSLFENGHSIDGIQIGNASDVLVEGNTVRDYDQSIANGYHADCVQIFDSVRVTVRGNRLGDCYNAGVILSPGAGKGMTDIVIESNFIQGCVVKTTLCAGGSAVDLRPPSISGLVVRGNTILDGSTRLVASPGLVFDRNIVGYLSDCAAPVTNSVLLSWNTAVCARPASLGAAGTRYGVVDFRDRSAGDLHLTNPTQARISQLGTVATAARDIDGQSVDVRLAGADAVPGANLGAVPSPVPPTSGAGGGGGSNSITLTADAGSSSDIPGIDAYFASKGISSAASFSIPVSGKVVVRGTRVASGWTVAWNLTGVPPASYATTAVVVSTSGATTSVPVTVRVVAP